MRSGFQIPQQVAGNLFDFFTIISEEFMSAKTEGASLPTNHRTVFWGVLEKEFEEYGTGPLTELTSFSGFQTPIVLVHWTSRKCLGFLKANCQRGKFLTLLR